MSRLLEILARMDDQMEGAPAKRWSADEWQRAHDEVMPLIEAESSVRELGEALRRDRGHSLPIEIIVAVYRRLMALGARDALTVSCFTAYLGLYAIDDEASSMMRSQVEPAARAAGLWDSPHLGFHPVFFRGPPFFMFFRKPPNVMNGLLALLTGDEDPSGGSSEHWSTDDGDRGVGEAKRLIGSESSFGVLGEALWLDADHEVPVEVVVAVYRRLMALGARDARTVVCFARYLLAHGPDWDDEANSMLAQVEPVARAAGLWDSPHLGHHPVFFSDR